MPVEIATNIYQFQLIGAKITVLLSGDKVLVIDTGTRGSLNRIKTAFSSLGIDRNQVSLIVLTHHHPDHSGGVSELSKYTDAPIAAHRLDAGITQGIVGDALEFRSGKLLHASKSFTADIPKAADSLKKLLDYDFETLCFSHFEPLTENAYGQLELLLDNL